MMARRLEALRALPRFETAILVVATVLLVALGVVRSRSGVRATFDSYSTYDPASGGYRAYYVLLEREGVRVERFRGHPVDLGAWPDTLVWAEPLPFDPSQGQTTAADARALEEWVRGGGNLLYIGHDDAAAKVGLLRLPATRPRDARGHRARVAAALRAAGVATLASTATLRWRSPKRGRVLVDDGRGPLVVSYSFGRGSVVAVIDETLFTNGGIAAHDRARLAVALGAPARPGATLAFDEAVHGYVSPRHWWSVVPRAFVVAIALSTVALLVAFTGAAIRLGPPVLPVRRDDRSSADFIDGLASLFARGHAAQGALADALGSTSRVVARALGLDEGASHDEIASRIHSDDRRAAYRELVGLATNAFAGETNLVRGVVLAQRIRKEFATHGLE